LNTIKSFLLDIESLSKRNNYRSLFSAIGSRINVIENQNREKERYRSDFDFDQWIPCLVKEILEDPSIQNRDIFEIKKARKQFDARFSGDSWLDLAKLISFELFLRDIGEN
jgi:hypothetical protein